MRKFILGILSIILFIPVCESLSELICGFIEIVKGKNTLKVLEINEEIAKVQSRNEETYTHAIGFQYTPQEEYYEEEDDY